MLKYKNIKIYKPLVCQWFCVILYITRNKNNYFKGGFKYFM